MPRTERVVTSKNEKLDLPSTEVMISQRPTNIKSVIDCIHGITYWYARRNLGSTGNWICLKLRQVKTVTSMAMAPTEESSAEDVAQPHSGHHVSTARPT
jgi:hypothetical protein